MSDQRDADEKALLAELQALPVLSGDDPALAKRQRAEARSAYERAFAPEPWYASLFGGGFARRAAVPVVLASIALVYMSWAVGAAMKLMQ